MANSISTNAFFEGTNTTQYNGNRLLSTIYEAVQGTVKHVSEQRITAVYRPLSPLYYSE